MTRRWTLPREAVRRWLAPPLHHSPAADHAIRASRHVEGDPVERVLWAAAYGRAVAEARQLSASIRAARTVQAGGEVA